MSRLSQEEIKRLIQCGNTGEYSHMLICLDHFDYEYFTRYVKHEENIHAVIEGIKSGGSVGMFTVEEIYNFNLDLESQLDDQRAYYIEPQIELESSINPKIVEALEFATRMHEGQFRHNGAPYIEHPKRVAVSVTKFKKSNNIDILVIASLLHDTLEDTKATYYDLIRLFGSAVASLVLELTTDKDLKKEMGKTRYLEIKMKNMSSWALVIKLCDRLDNISDLNNSSDEFKKRYIEETIEIIGYVVNNRNLSLTHIMIINQILTVLFGLDPFDETKNNKLYSIFQQIKEIEYMKDSQIQRKLINPNVIPSV